MCNFLVVRAPGFYSNRGNKMYIIIYLGVYGNKIKSVWKEDIIIFQGYFRHLTEKTYDTIFN